MTVCVLLQRSVFNSVGLHFAGGKAATPSLAFHALKTPGEYDSEPPKENMLGKLCKSPSTGFRGAGKQKNAIFAFLRFQRLSAIETGGTSLCHTEPLINQRFLRCLADFTVTTNLRALSNCGDNPLNTATSSKWPGCNEINPALWRKVTRVLRRARCFGNRSPDSAHTASRLLAEGAGRVRFRATQGKSVRCLAGLAVATDLRASSNCGDNPLNTATSSRGSPAYPPHIVEYTACARSACHA